jgi:thiol-disulfide isomerase/thioredoxin
MRESPDGGDWTAPSVGCSRNAVRLTQYRGKVVVVSFFASWRGPCRKELPMLESLQCAGADNGLLVIAVGSARGTVA